MNNAILNAELALALRKCLPFVRRHAIISGGDGSLTYAFAVRALADADARQQEEQRVKNIVNARTAEHKGWCFAVEPVRVNGTLSDINAYAQAARAVRPGGGYLPVAPPAKGCDCDTCTAARRRSLERAMLENFNRQCPVGSS